MPTIYMYELWNGKNVVGYHRSTHLLQGNHVEIFEVSILKERYNKAYKPFKIPITTRVISDNGIDVHTRVCLDVRRKSIRQINWLQENATSGL